MNPKGPLTWDNIGDNLTLLIDKNNDEHQRTFDTGQHW